MAQNHNAEYIEKPMTRDGRIQGPSRRYRRLRHPTFPSTEWTAKNPLLQRGEIGAEADSHRIKVGDGLTYWNDLPYASDAIATWGAINGNINDQTDLKNALDAKQDVIADLATIRSNASAGKAASDTIATYGNIVTHNVSEFATAAQGTKADSALQPGDNVSELVNDAGYLTQHQTLADLGITATASEINVLDGITANTTELNYVDGVTSNIQTQIDGKQPKSTSAYNMGNTSGGWTAMSNTQQNALNSGANTTNIGQIATNTSNIANEIINRQNADNGLQSQIDAIVAKSDVVDIVGTYAELQAYDTSSLGNNDVVKVLDDSTHNDAPSYYRWVITGGVGAWVYIGSESETYTKAETDALLNAKQNNITATDGITLTGTTLTNSGVRAVASGTANGTISVNTNGTSADVAVYGLGSAAYTASTDYATSAQGALADTAVQPGDLATVATTGDYDDLLNKPTIPTVNDSTITVTQNGSSVGSFTLNQASDDTIALTDTTYSVMTGASAGDAGASGLVPAPAAGDQAKFLQGDGTWANPTAATAWGNITGTLSDQTDLNTALSGKQATITGAATTITTNNLSAARALVSSSTGKVAVSTVTSTELGYLHGVTSAVQTQLNNKQATLTAGTNINITGSTISATDTTYTGSDGVTLTGTNFTNSGVRAVATGTTSGTVSVNTNGTSTDVAVNGWSNKADDNAVVHLTGAETITGQKTFQNASMSQEITSGSYLDFYQYIDGDRRGAIRTWKDSNDANHYYTIFGNCGPNAEAPKGLAVHRNASTIWTTAETPESGDNSSKIATTEWVHSAAPNLVMPSSVSITLTTAASGNTYQAPADGYFRVSGTASAAGQRLNVDCNQIGFQGFSYASRNEVKFSCPIKKGDNMYLAYNMPQANVVVRFVYAVGAAG